MQADQIYRDVCATVVGNEVSNVLTALGMLVSHILSSKEVGTYEQRRKVAVHFCNTVLECVALERQQGRTH